MQHRKRSFKRILLGMVCTIFLAMFAVCNVLAAEQEEEVYGTEPEQQITEQPVNEATAASEVVIKERIYKTPVDTSKAVEVVEETEILKNSDEDQQDGSSTFAIPEKTEDELLVEKYLSLYKKGPVYFEGIERAKAMLSMQDSIWQQPAENVEEKGVIPIPDTTEETSGEEQEESVNEDSDKVIEQVPKEKSVKKTEQKPKQEPQNVEVQSLESEQLEEQAESVEEVSIASQIESEKLIPLGTYRTTAYCPCSKCNGKWTTTATGADMQENHTVAVDPKVIPLNSKIVINGIEYTAEDTGGAIKGKRIDIFHGTHREALNYGVRYAEVYRVAA